MTDYPTLTFSETVDELRRLVTHLDSMTRQASEDEIEDKDELHTAIEMLVALNSVKGSLYAAYSSYEATIAAAMEEDYSVNLPGNIVVTRREGAAKKGWEHKRLGKVVAERLVAKSVDYDTGEILMDTEEIVTALLQYAAPSYWRVRELKKLGIDAKKYCKTGDPKVSVAIERKG